jgi:hypothetical protein
MGFWEEQERIKRDKARPDVGYYERGILRRASAPDLPT